MSDSSNTNRPYPAQAWRMPPLSTIWLCDDGCERTLGEMIAGLGDGAIPKCDEDVIEVLDRYGADWTSPVITSSFMQRDEAVAALSDPNRYQESEDCLIGYKRMRWAFDYLVNDTIA